MRRIIDAANAAIGIFAGLYLVSATISGSTALQRAPELILSRWSPWGAVVFFLLGAVLVYGNISVLYREWRTGGLRRNLRITTEQGASELSVTALEMLLLRRLSAEPDIVDPVCVLTPRGVGKPMLCEVELKLRRQDDVIRFVDGIKRSIRDDFDRLIPGGLTVEVLVEVRDFVTNAADAPREESGKVMNGPDYSAYDSDHTDGE